MKVFTFVISSLVELSTTEICSGSMSLFSANSAALSWIRLSSFKDSLVKSRDAMRDLESTLMCSIRSLQRFGASGLSLISKWLKTVDCCSFCLYSFASWNIGAFFLFCTFSIKIYLSINSLALTKFPPSVYLATFGSIGFAKLSRYSTKRILFWSIFSFPPFSILFTNRYLILVSNSSMRQSLYSSNLTFKSKPYLRC